MSRVVIDRIPHGRPLNSSPKEARRDRKHDDLHRFSKEQMRAMVRRMRVELDAAHRTQAETLSQVLYLACSVLLSRRHRLASWIGRLFGWQEPTKNFLVLCGETLINMRAAEKSLDEKAHRKAQAQVWLLAKEGVEAVEGHAKEGGDSSEVVNIRPSRSVENPGDVSAGDASPAGDVTPGGDLTRLREEG